MITVAGYSNLQLIYQSARTLSYSGRRKSDGAQVVLRLLRPEVTSPEQVARYRREFELLRNVDSDFIVRAEALIEQSNSPILVMRSIGGASIAELLKRQSLSVREVLTIAIAVTRGLDDLHAAHIVHKNINPDNIIYNQNTGAVSIVDLGIARMAPSAVASEPSGNPEGTLTYIAPEQTGRLNRSIDYRADFYALGVTLFEMLTGSPPFSSSDSLELVYHHLATPPATLHTVDASIPVGLANIVAKLLAKMPEDRYQSAYAIKQDLMRCFELLDQPSTMDAFEVALDDIPEQLNISERLLERGEQLETLRRALHDTTEGATVVVACAGDAGTGKSSLIRELQKDVAGHQGFLVTARHHHLSADQPYGGVSAACSDLIRQLLARPDIDAIRQRITRAIEGSEPILFQLAPELKILLGRDAPAPEESESLRPTEARSRLINGLSALIRAVASADSPLVLSIENLHWTDQATIDLFEPLLTQSQIPWFMLICTYRPRELASNSQTRQAIERIFRANPDIRLIRMENLTTRSIATLISDSLYRPFEETLKLAEVVHGKTEGNPLAVREFLNSLARDNILYFDRDHREWACDLQAAGQLPPTDNVSKMLAEKIEELEAVTADLLKIASCAGEQFDLDTIRSVSGLSFSETSARLLHAVREGYLIHKPVDDGSGKRMCYQFAHERIQQAAYTLLTTTQRRKIHTSIGHTFLHNDEDTRDEKIFEIVNQLNNSFESPDPTFVDKNRLAELNLSAGRKAKQSAAFQSAFKYFRTAIALHGQNVWAQYDLSLDLHLEAAETAYLCGDLQQLDVLIERTLAHARSSLDQARAYEIKLRALVAFNDLDRALELGHEVLELLDVPVSDRMASLKGISLLARLVIRTMRMRTEDVVDARPMTDPRRLAAMRILMILCQAGYLNGSEATGFYILKMTQLSLKHGMAPETSFAYPMFGALLITNLGTIELGYRFGMLAHANLDDDNRELHCKTIFLVNNFIRIWKHHIRESLEPLGHAYRIGMETGDIEFALISTITGSANAFMLGHDLHSLESNLANYNQKASEFNQTPILSMGSIYQQAARNLMSPNSAPWLLEGDIYSENELLQFHEDSGDESSIANLYIVKLFLAVLFNHREHAVEFSREARARLASVVSSPAVPFFILYESLACVSAIEARPGAWEEWSYRLRIRMNQRRLRKWAHHAPENVLHGYHLVEAELARLRGDPTAALDHYDRAIALAESNGYLKEYALGNERCGRYHLEANKRDLALFYLRQARASYVRWGALAKVSALDTEFVELADTENLERRRQRFGAGSAQATPAFRSYGNYLDLGSVIKASQVLSGEIILDNLLERLMQVALENAGAHNASLVLSHGEDLVLEITARYDGSESLHERQNIPIAEATNLPVSVVQYVARTQEDLILNDALNEDIFTQDEYIISLQPKSILCIPILSKSHLTGVLYLENLQTTLAFSQERVAILKLLASQSAIAIENAKLYQQLNESRDKYLSLYQNAVEGIFEIDGDGTLTNINPAAAQLLGFASAEEAAMSSRKSVTDWFVNPEDTDTLQKVLAEERRIVGYETQIKRRDGEALWIALSAQMFDDAEHEDYRIEGSIIDITERKLREEAEQATRIAQAATESKSQFLANMSHEIRTPMNAITGYTDLALRTELSEQQKNYLETIKNSSNHLLRVVNDILDLSKVESGKLELQHVPFKLADIFRDLQNLFGLEAAERGLTLNIPDPDSIDDAFYVGDPARIGQVLINLVSNALKFTDSGSIDVEYELATLNDEGVCINFTVTDTGIGIAEHELEYIFESFAQGSIVSPNAGTGLGLAISKSLVEMMQGHIHAVSEKDAGSSFYFSVVVDHWREDPLPLPPQRDETPIQLDGQRVLLVEDNQINQDLAREVLRQAGLEVDVANNGREALDLLLRIKYFAVLMDLRMPEMDGLEAIKRVRANSAIANVPVVALSAGVLKEEVEAALRAGFDYYLPKPVDFQELIELLQHIGGFEAASSSSTVQPAPTIDVGHIDGVDFGRALRNHNNDIELLSRLLDDFVSFYSTADNSLESMIATGDWGKAERLAHNIAGVAGSFGAMSLMAAARSLEHHLMDGSDTTADVNELSRHLHTFMSAIDRFKHVANSGAATG